MKKFLFLIITILLSSCGDFTKLPQETEDALQKSGKNFNELFDVIVRYKDTDTMKLHAANFLIANAQYKYFLDTIDGERICDLEVLTAQTLTNNIDLAFDTYQKSWNKNLCFDDFKEFLLPYRIADEKLSNWRRDFAENYSDSLLSDSIDTPEKVAQIVNDEIIKNYPDFTNCNDFAMRATFIMRSCGIPVALAIIPHWGTRAESHIFNVLKTQNELIDFLGGENTFGSHLAGFHDNIPKVYMLSFSKQTDSPHWKYPKEEKPAFFKNIFLKDITAQLSSIETSDYQLNIDSRNKLAYLCVFDRIGWIPVAYGEIKDKKVNFNNVGINVVYQLATFDDGEIQCIGNPFLALKNGEIRNYNPSENTFNQTLTRKSPESNRWEEVEKQIPGGKFQGANREDFSDSVTLFSITEIPDLKFQQAEVANYQKFRYLRYLSSNKTYGNMAEVEFYDSNEKKLQHKRIFGQYKPSLWFPDFTAEKLFDGDVLTFFHTSDSLAWGAIELDAPQAVSKIRYKIRNDDNGIRSGEIYELFYAKDGSWISLGKQTAAHDDEITFKNLPKNALFWLRNLSKGTEERIFEVDDSEIVWR